MENSFEISPYIERNVETKEEEIQEMVEFISPLLQFHKQPIPVMTTSIYNINVTKDQGIQKKIVIQPSKDSNLATLGSKVQSF
jgi:hypothetical protein